MWSLILFFVFGYCFWVTHRVVYSLVMVLFVATVGGILFGAYMFVFFVLGKYLPDHQKIRQSKTAITFWKWGFFGLAGIFACWATIAYNQPTISGTTIPQDYYCHRSQPYAMPPEFQRAMSLIAERSLQYNQSTGVPITPNPKQSIYNCLDIQYADLSRQQAEGMFIFDKTSTSDDLKIYVDSSYQEHNDYLTAILLSHEITHANQFVQQILGKNQLSCYDKEIQAFENETAFMGRLNLEERTALVQLIQPNPDLNSAYTGVWQLIQFDHQAAITCGNDQSCAISSIQNQITAMVENSPGYQQECANNISPSIDQNQ